VKDNVFSYHDSQVLSIRHKPL